MTELITLAVVLAIGYVVHQAALSLRDRRKPPEKTLLERLGYNPERHLVRVTLKNGDTLTGIPDTRTQDPLQHGLALTQIDIPHVESAGILTFIPGHQITAITVTGKTPPARSPAEK